jgi:hypothetical protein
LSLFWENAAAYARRLAARAATGAKIAAPDGGQQGFAAG